MLLVTLLKGIVVGIVIALPVGPVGVLCVRRTLYEGPVFGFVSGLGAATADMIFGIIAGFGLTFIRDWLLTFQDWLGVAGGAFLLVIGLRALLAPTAAEPEPLSGEALLSAYASTFALTITNPLTILAFAAIFAKAGVSEATGFAGVAVLVVGVFLGSLVWWIGLSFGIGSFGRAAGAVRLVWLNRVAGVILTLSGCGLLGDSFLGLARV